MATILIVDDRPINRDVLRGILSYRGHRVLEAHDGLEALIKVGDEMPDLVVTDVMMPGMDGYQLVRELRANPETSALPVIFATANYLEREVIPLARAYGVRRVLTKTDDADELCSAIEAELDARVPRQALPIDENVTREHMRTVNAKLVEKVRQMQDNEAELRRSEQRFRLIAEAAPVGIVLMNTMGKALYVNERLGQVLKRSVDELADTGWLTAIGLEGDRGIGELLAGGRDAVTWRQWPIELSDGTAWLDISLHNAYDDQAQVLQCVGVVADVTETVRAMERQREMDHRLRVAERLESLGQLAGGVAHDFNNILTAILGYAQVAQVTTEDGVETGTVDAGTAALLRRSLDGLVTGANRAAKLTAQLLAFGRPDIAEPELTDINECLTEVRTLLEPAVGAGIEIVDDRDADVPLIFIDNSQLGQVVLNLAINSRDAMPEGGRLVLRTRDHRVERETRHGDVTLTPGRYARLTVTDSGQGIPANVLARVMDPFFTTKPPGKGTGLGLATVYSIVRQYRGHLVIQSTLGQGTTIDVYFPAADGDALPDPEPDERLPVD